MIVVTTGERFRLITQPAHAELSGQLADHWGNDRFDRPAPRSAVVLAAYHHDNGWWEEDLGPRLGPAGEPRNFLQSDRDRWVAFYDEGIDNVRSLDPYAGLLASMHGSGIRRRRYASQPAMPERRHDYSEFVASQEALQRQLLAELRRSDEYGEYVSDADVDTLETLHESGDVGDVGSDSRLLASYLLVQLFDRLSLYYCMNEPLEATRLGPVPVSDDETPLDLAITPVSESEVTLDPYPFDESPLDLSVSGRLLPARQYESEGALVDAYFTAPRRTWTITVRPP